MRKAIKIDDFLDSIGKELSIRRIPNSDFGYVASISGGETKSGNCLTSDVGHGWTPNDALKNLVKEISNKRIVFDAMNENRQEFDIPKLKV